ncbi:putative Cadherin-23 [Hypsibius exemplaris]|uniref:Cadherin-23 n=1 Tax=Hypsibius exemplaris TaxID=2072580 RepID=A0A1W0X3C0_HYPEX|nr:putative Cadherin-23 [Hypsibius exemplaris]
MDYRRSGELFTLVTLTVLIFIPGRWTISLSLPPGQLIIKEQASPGSLVTTIETKNGGTTVTGNATIAITDGPIPANTFVTLSGSCSTCFEVSAVVNEAVSVHVKSDYTWETCKPFLTNTPISEAVKLSFCPAQFELRDLSGTLHDTKTANIFVNQIPIIFGVNKLLPIVAQQELFAIDENTGDEHRIVRLVSHDPDVRQSEWHVRRLTIENCLEPCPFKLGNCSDSTGLSCLADISDDVRHDLLLVAPLDYEKQSVHFIQLKLTDANGFPEVLQNSVETVITLIVRDVQDTAPVFSSYPPLKVINEDIAVGASVLTVLAIDGDYGPNSRRILYTLVELDSTDNASSLPHLGIRTTGNGEGEVFVLNPFSAPGFVRINITATEVGCFEAFCVSSLVLRVQVDDVNNHAAEFYFVDSDGLTQSTPITRPVLATVSENSNVGTAVELENGALIRVEDLDQGVNAAFTLRIVENDIFEVSPVSVQGSNYLSIRVKNKTFLDAEEIRDPIELTIIAAQNQPTVGNLPESTLTVIITVGDVNDHESFFTPPGRPEPCEGINHYVMNTTETFYQGTRVELLDLGAAAALSDADRDAVNRDQRLFRLGNTEDHFSILPDGKLQVIRTLDFEAAQSHRIVVDIDNTGANGITKTSTCTIDLTVNDVNDEPPEFTNRTSLAFTVDEQLKDHPLVSLQAKDKDASADLKFSIELVRADGPGVIEDSDFPLSEHLSIISQESSAPGTWDAQLTVIKEFDREVIETIQARVMVTDEKSEVGVRTDEIALTITVRDVNNHAAEFLIVLANGSSQSILSTTVISATVTENSNAGTAVELADGVFIRARDLDLGANAAFTLQIVDDDIFEVSPTNVQGDNNLSIRVKNSTLLDAEVIRTPRILNIKATQTATAAGTLPESILRVNVTVLDVNDHASFYMLPETKLHCEGVNHLAITTEETIFTGKPVELLDMALTSTLSDNDRDPENRDRTQFRLAETEEHFAVTSAGKIQVIRGLDFETNGTHQIAVAIDNIGTNGITTSICTVDLTVDDVNDEAPEFTELAPRAFAVDENLEDHLLVTFEATDKDASGDLEFSIILVRALSPRGIEDGNFRLSDHISVTSHKNTTRNVWVAELTVKKGLDREQTEKITARVIVKDKNTKFGVETDELPITITVNNLNDNMPSITFNSLPVPDGDSISPEVPENHNSVNRVDFLVSDLDDTTTFHKQLLFIEDKYKDHVIFAPTTDDGRITLLINKTFDYEEIKILPFTLLVTDLGVEPIQQTRVLINLKITDKNDNNPIIDFPLQYNGTIPVVTLVPESYGNNLTVFEQFSILTVNATDADSEAFLPLNYYLNFDDAPGLVDFLAIDKESGIISVLKALDREAPGMDQELTLQVRVQDNMRNGVDQRRSDPTNFRIRITDVNDNQPVFSSPNGYFWILLEKDNLANTVLPFIKQQATDDDLPNGCGKIIYSITTPNVPVMIDQNTANLTITSKLEGDLQFNVEAFDGSVAGCDVGSSRVTVPMTVKILVKELLYEMIVNIEMDNAEEKLAAIDRINQQLELIANLYDFDYVYYGIENPKSRATGPQVLNFAFLNRTTQANLVKEEVTKILGSHVAQLKAVGMTNLGTAVVTDTSPAEPFDQKWIAVIVMGVAVLALVVVASVFFAEKRKLTLKLRATKAMEGTGMTNPGVEGRGPSLSPYGATGTQKVNPILAKYGVDRALELKHSFAEHHDYELDEVAVADESDADASSTDRDSVGGLENIEAAAAQSNRQMIQAQLRNGHR